LLAFGVDFTSSAPIQNSYALIQNSYAHYTTEHNDINARYIDGILYSGRTSKGKILSQFLDMLFIAPITTEDSQQQNIDDLELFRMSSNMRIPKEIVFIDDQKYNIKSVSEWLSNKKLERGWRQNGNMPRVSCNHSIRASYKYIEKVYGVKYNHVDEKGRSMETLILKEQLRALFFGKKIINDETAIASILQRDCLKIEKIELVQ